VLASQFLGDRLKKPDRFSRQFAKVWNTFNLLVLDVDTKLRF
jgi:hypothetical protein